MHDRLAEGDGFIAALDQSGGTTPKAARPHRGPVDSAPSHARHILFEKNGAGQGPSPSWRAIRP
jgi:fructose-bisphosphate aldolase class 1